jgi:hypothetical protein
LTDEARDTILAEAARKAQEAPGGDDGAKTPPEDDAEKKRKAAKKLEQDAKDQYMKANEDGLVEADNAHKKAQAICTKNNKAVELAQKRIKAAEKAKAKADKVHAESFLQLDATCKAADAANSLVAEAENSKTTGEVLEDLQLKASIAASDQSGYAPQVKHNLTTKKGAGTALINRQAEVVPLLAAVAEADTSMQLATTQLQTTTAAREVALQALTKLEDPNTVAPTTKAQLAKQANAVKKYKKATADAKRAQTALATVHAACTKKSKDVALAKSKTKKAARVKMKADRAHRAVVVQRDLPVQAAGYTKSQLTAAGQRKAGQP